MRKFCQEQEVDSIETLFVSDIEHFLPQTSLGASSITTQCATAEQVLSFLRIAYAPLQGISTFSFSLRDHTFVKALSPYEEKFLDSSLVKDLRTVYEQQANCSYTILL